MRHVLHGERVLVDGALREAFVVIEGERIVGIEAAPQGLPTEGVGELVLLPGLVDAHVHVNEPGRTEWEGFETATRAAAAGGITTLVDMPLNCIPVTTTAAALAEKLEACAPHLWVDCAFWGGVVPGNAGELPGLVAGGVRGCKAFLCPSGIDDFPHVGEADLREAMICLAEAGVPLLAHAELEHEVGTHDDPRQYASWLRARPPSFECEAIALLIRLVRETGCRLHVVHLSAADAVPMLAEARAEGLPVTVETCPHYLCLTAEEVPDGATAFKCAPPIREAENRDRLWQALRDGVIDVVVSDHSPCTPHLKLPERGDFLAAWGGIASLQLGLSSVWTEARRRGFSLPDVARWMATASAAHAGLDHKGAIAVGRDADLVAFDPDERWTVEADALLHRHKVSPWVGRTLEGRVRKTWLRGTALFDGERRGRPLLGGMA